MGGYLSLSGFINTTTNITKQYYIIAPPPWKIEEPKGKEAVTGERKSQIMFLLGIKTLWPPSHVGKEMLII